MTIGNGANTDVFRPGVPKRPGLPEEFGATLLEIDEIIRVVQEAHAIGFAPVVSAPNDSLATNSGGRRSDT